MLYPTCSMISNVDLAHYGVSRAKDWASVDFGTTTIINNKIILVILVHGVVLAEFHGKED